MEMHVEREEVVVCIECGGVLSLASRLPGVAQLLHAPDQQRDERSLHQRDPATQGGGARLSQSNFASYRRRILFFGKLDLKPTL